jgi:hypothetical protein
LIALRAGASRSRSWFAVSAAAFLVAALLAVPGGVLAASTQLSLPSVTPTVGTTATTFTFGVTYQNHEGSGAPDEVSIVIDGVKHAMIPGGNDWKAGVRFTYSTTLAAGSHTIAFHSVGRSRFTFDMSGGTVAVGPAPTPQPTPAPTHRPSSPPPTTPPSNPPSGSGSSRGSGAAGGSGSSGSGSAGSGSAGSGSAGSGSRSGVTRPFGDGRSDVARAGGPRLSARVPVRVVSNPSSAGNGDARKPADSDYAGAGWGDLSLYLKALSWGGSATRSMPLLPSIIFAMGTMAVLMAFMFFGKRRRDGEPPDPDEVLSAAAARGAGQAATATLVPTFPVIPGVREDEIGMPRWRRPSLLEARKMDPARSAVAVAPPLTFARGGAARLVDGHERRYIRYHVVGLLDMPDEFRGTEIGELARDDEVQLLERSGTYWRVLCPDGREGWIHKMTLGDVVGEPSSPTPAEAWANTRPWDDMENGVLTAFMAARGRA